MRWCTYTKIILPILLLGMEAQATPLSSSPNPIRFSVTPVEKDASAIEISLWAEAPEWDSNQGASDYFSELREFIKLRDIKRLMIRLEDPVANAVYFIGPTQTPSTQTLIDGLLLHEDFMATGCQVYVIPWLFQKIPPYTDPTKDSWDKINYPYPPPNLPSYVDQQTWDQIPNNLQRAALWVQLANEYVQSQNPTGMKISGIVYESEGAGYWSDKTKALPEYESALQKYLRAPSPAYSNDADSAFVLSSADQFDFDTAGTGVYLQQIYPQMYNLTRGDFVDATSTQELIGKSIPLFPETLYTLCKTSSGAPDPSCMVTGPGDSAFDGFKELNNPPILAAVDNRPDDVNYMFSAEQAPSSVFGIPNSYRWRNTSIVHPKENTDLDTGTINAFGVENWKDWSDFYAFLQVFSDDYFNSNDPGEKANTFARFGLFQFNLLPETWGQSADLAAYLGHAAKRGRDTDAYGFKGKRGEKLEIFVWSLEKRTGPVRMIIIGPGGYRKIVSGGFPVQASLALPRRGTYRIKLTNRRHHRDERFVGRYLLSMRCAGGGSQPCSTPVPAWRSLRRIRPD